MNDDQVRWICGKCRKPIEEGKGFIDLYNLNPTLGAIGAYPRNASEMNECGFETKKNVGIRVVHDGCNQTGRSGYWFAVERASTADEWINWLAHLSEKDWCGKMEFMRLADMWRSRPRPVVKVTP